jgi:cobalt transporter subunit CbtA
MVQRGRTPFLRGLLLPALLAGLAAGIVAASLQQAFLVPLILRAEALEAATQAAAEVGLQRAAYSLLFTCLDTWGFALLLAGCYALRGNVSWRRGLFWGLAGFVCFSLAPALGLPPELPGLHPADLLARQLWWITTALATAAGLACVVFPRSMAFNLLGIALIALPHIIGAPAAIQSDTAVPSDMARAFALGSLAVSAVMWLILGSLIPVLTNRNAAYPG